jgi:hypothetical protein
VKIVIFGVGDTDGLHQECQLEEFVGQETRDYRSSGVADAVEDLVAKSSCPFVVVVGGTLGCLMSWWEGILARC